MDHRRRQHVRLNVLKPFGERYTSEVRGRIQAIKPGYYTRMGAVRHAAGILAAQPAPRRLLLLLTDGKPNDLDRYEGRYGAEDTRMAVPVGPAGGTAPVLRHHRHPCRRLSAAPVWSAGIRGHSPARRPARPPAPAVRTADGMNRECRPVRRFR